MTRLARCPCKSGIQASILDNTGPNTRPNEHANKIVASPPRSIQVFTKGSNLNIVSNSNRFAKLLVEDASKRHIFHAQVWGVHDDSCFTIDLSCGADTNRNNARAVRKSCPFSARVRLRSEAITAPVVISTTAARALVPPRSIPRAYTFCFAIYISPLEW